MKGTEVVRGGKLLHKVGVGLLSMTAALYLTTAMTWLYCSNGALAMVFFLISVPTLAVSAVVFLVDLLVAEERRGMSAVCCVFSLAMPLLCLLVVLPANRYLETLRHAQTLATFNQVIADVETVRLRIGRVPANELELTEVLGRALPKSAWRDPIYYRLDTSTLNHYVVSCLTGDFAGTIYRYDSRNKADGVVVELF